MEAQKANKVYQIDKAQVDEYAKAGYDIYDGGKLVKHAVGKSVPIEKYEALEAEVAKLRQELAAKKAPAKSAKAE